MNTHDYVNCYLYPALETLYIVGHLRKFFYSLNLDFTVSKNMFGVCLCVCITVNY